MVGRLGLAAVLARLGLGGSADVGDEREPLPRRTRRALDARCPTFVTLDLTNYGGQSIVTSVIF